VVTPSLQISAHTSGFHSTFSVGASHPFNLPALSFLR